MGIPGNERADGVAKAALSLPISSLKTSVTDFFTRAKLLMRSEWQEIWHCCDCNKLHAINPTVGVIKENGSLSRRDAVIINRLQINHSHAHLLGDEDEAVCTTCYTSLTVYHILIECPRFNHLRQQYHFGNTLIYCTSHVGRQFFSTAHLTTRLALLFSRRSEDRPLDPDRGPEWRLLEVPVWTPKREISGA